MMRMVYDAYNAHPAAQHNEYNTCHEYAEYGTRHNQIFPSSPLLRHAHTRTHLALLRPARRQRVLFVPVSCRASIARTASVSPDLHLSIARGVAQPENTVADHCTS